MVSNSRSGGNGNDYSSARRLVALLLSGFLGAILLIDAVSTDYAVDPVVTGSILGAIVAIMGVDVSKRFGEKRADDDVAREAERVLQASTEADRVAVQTKEAADRAAKLTREADEATRIAAEATERARIATATAQEAAEAAEIARDATEKARLANEAAKKARDAAKP